MPGVSFSCPKCGKTLKSPQPIAAGKKIKCPTCAAVFAMPPQEDEEKAAVKAKRAAAPRDDDDEDDIQDKPRAKKRAVVDDEDDDEPRARKRDRADEEDDDDDDRPRGKKGRKSSSGKGLLIGGIILVVVLLLGGGGVGAYFLWFAGVNRGSGEEDPLAYVPAGTEALLGVDLAGTLDDKDAGPIISQTMMQGFSGAPRDRVVKLIEKMAKETGLSRNELASQMILTTSVDSLSVDNKGGMGAGGMGPGGAGPGGRGPGGPAGGGRGPGPGGMGPGATPMGTKAGTLILHASKPFDQKKIAKSFNEAKRNKSNGKYYYEITDTDFSTLFMPSDRTLILSSRPASDLESIFQSDGKAPSISADAVSLVRGVEKSSIWAVVPFEGKVRTEIDEGMRKDPPPPEIKDVAELIVKGKGIAVWASLTGDQVSLGINVACTDAAAASQLAQVADKTWKDESPKALALFGLFALVSPKVNPVVDAVKKSVKFTAEGTMAKGSLGASRTLVVEAVNDVKTKLANVPGGAGGGDQNPPGRGGGKPRGGK